MSIWQPNEYKKNIFEINYNKLKKQNIKYLIYDLDNTIGLIDEDVCRGEISDFLNTLSKDFTILIASNNNKNRVELFTKNIKCKYIFYALKPTRRLYWYIKKYYTKNMNEVTIIGDQLVTDILVGNRFNMHTILVDPLAKKDLKITKLNRIIESFAMKRIKFKKGDYYEKKI